MGFYKSGLKLWVLNVACLIDNTSLTKSLFLSFGERRSLLSSKAIYFWEYSLLILLKSLADFDTYHLIIVQKCEPRLTGKSNDTDNKVDKSNRKWNWNFDSHLFSTLARKMHHKWIRYIAKIFHFVGQRRYPPKSSSNFCMPLIMWII